MTSLRTVPQIAKFADLPESTVRDAMDRSTAVEVQRVGRVRVIATADVPTLLNEIASRRGRLLESSQVGPQTEANRMVESGQQKQQTEVRQA